jgi:tetratricopeptide (TPR) repeat protein
MAVQLFLSCVSDEFGFYRDPLRRELTIPDVAIKIQEEFKPQGGDTLSMLAEYIASCAAVVHFVGDMPGAPPPKICVEALLRRYPDIKDKLPPLGKALDEAKTISYTQWEAWLAIYLEKAMLIVVPGPGAKRGPKFGGNPESKAAQAEHLERLKSLARYPGDPFVNEHNLATQILRSTVIPALKRAAEEEAYKPERKPRNLPFASLGSRFMGRDQALEELRMGLMDAKSVAVAGRALHGLGGIGKTRLAIEYALRYETEYSALLFVRAEDAAALNRNLAALAGAEVLDLPEKEAREDEPKIEAALNWLEAHPLWLMILDNVDDKEAVEAVAKLMARLKGGHVIVTARASNFPGSLRKLELGVLDEGAATAFLMERTADDRDKAPDDEETARELARELDGLALGLEQAGTYIARQHIGFALYLTLWREKRERVLKWFDRTTMSYDHDVGLAMTWATSVEKLTPESRRLLDRLAFFAPDPVPDSLLDVAAPGETEDTDARDALAGLYAYSLVTRAGDEDGAGKGFVVHRLVQDFARRAMPPERAGEALREALGWVNAALEGEPWDVRTWSVLEPLAPHALAVARRADEAGIADPTGRAFVYLGGLLKGKARYAEAEPLYRRALAIDEASLGPDHTNVANHLNNLASLLQDTNRLGEAEPLYRRALKIDEARLGPDHPSVAIGLNNLAGLLQTTNRIAEAEPLYRRALKIDEASLGPDHPNVAIRLNNLAELLRATNRLAEAEPLYRRALGIWETSYGPDHPQLAIGLTNLAVLLKNTNRLDEAGPLYRRALNIDEASLGPDHPHVAFLLSNLAELLRVLGKLDEAEPLIRRALAIDEASYGPDHPNVAIRLNNLAGLLYATNRLGEAEPLFRRALAIREASYGTVHPDVAQSLNNLAELLRTTNRLGEAEPLYRRALTIWETSYGPDHPQVAIGLNNLALLLQATKRLGEEEPLYRRALKIDEASYGPDHPRVAIRLNNLALLLQATDRPDEAEPLYRRAVKIDEASYGPDHPKVALRLNNLAGLLFRTNRLAEAEALLGRALAIYEKSLGADHPDTEDVRAGLIALEAARGVGAPRGRRSRGRECRTD